MADHMGNCRRMTANNRKTDARRTERERKKAMMERRRTRREEKKGKERRERIAPNASMKNAAKRKGKKVLSKWME